MMKETYIAPVMDVVELENDVILTSQGTSCIVVSSTESAISTSCGGDGILPICPGDGIVICSAHASGSSAVSCSSDE